MAQTNVKPRAAMALQTLGVIVGRLDLVVEQAGAQDVARLLEADQNGPLAGPGRRRLEQGKIAPRPDMVDGQPPRVRR